MDWQVIEHGLDAIGEHATSEQLAALKQMGREIAVGGEARLRVVEQVLALIGDRWGALILMVLATGRLRHAGLRRSLHAISPERLISQRVLTLKLRAFERHGLLERRTIPDARVIVDYELTQKGYELVTHVRKLIDWLDEYPASASAADTSSAG